MSLRRYKPHPQKRRWLLYCGSALMLSVIIFFMGLRTVQVGLSLTLGLYLDWIFRRD